MARVLACRGCGKARPIPEAKVELLHYFGEAVFVHTHGRGSQYCRVGSGVHCESVGSRVRRRAKAVRLE